MANARRVISGTMATEGWRRREGTSPGTGSGGRKKCTIAADRAKIYKQQSAGREGKQSAGREGKQSAGCEGKSTTAVFQLQCLRGSFPGHKQLQQI